MAFLKNTYGHIAVKIIHIKKKSYASIIKPIVDKITTTLINLGR